MIGRNVRFSSPKEPVWRQAARGGLPTMEAG